MKIKISNLLKRMLNLSLVLTFGFSLSSTTYGVQETWNKGEKASFVPSYGDRTYEPGEWTKNLVDLYQLNWYEAPERQVLKGEFMLAQLRAIQASLERRGLTTLSAEEETLDFKDNNTLTGAAQEEAKILKSLGILDGTPEGYMEITNPIKRSEAAKIIAVLNDKVLKVPAIKNPKVFTDTKGHWAEKNISTAYQINLLNGMSHTTFSPNESLTLEQTLQILENEVGYYGIKRVDVAKAMNETFKATMNTDLSNDIIAKKLNFRLNKTSVYPGDSFAVFVSNTQIADNFSVTAPFYNKPIRFYKHEDGFVGLIPVYAWAAPGTYKIQASDAHTKQLTTLEVNILPKTFDVQYLKVAKSTAAIATTNNSAKDQVHFDAARANPIEEKLWDGAFIQPAKGRITTDYCATRYTNDNPTPSRHLAIDIANNTGTPIMASNNGKVVLAKKLIITGNTIVIDHGLGVFTSYMHLSSISVKEKDFVTKGNVIGKMGSTGYSTGPHLHFAIWKDGTFLNPWTFFEKDPIAY